jgi:hypothetical protein
MSTKPELPWTEGLTPIPNPVEMKLLSMESLPELPKPGRELSQRCRRSKHCLGSGLQSPYLQGV